MEHKNKIKSKYNQMLKLYIDSKGRRNNLRHQNRTDKNKLKLIITKKAK